MNRVFKTYVFSHTKYTYGEYVYVRSKGGGRTDGRTDGRSVGRTDGRTDGRSDGSGVGRDGFGI